MHKSSHVASIALSIFVLFPRLLLRPLPDGCQGGLAAAALNTRCRLLIEGDIATFILEAHEAQTERVAKLTKASSVPSSSTSHSKIAKATIMIGANYPRYSNLHRFPKIGLFPNFSRTISYRIETLTARFKSHQLNRWID